MIKLPQTGRQWRHLEHKREVCKELNRQELDTFPGENMRRSSKTPHSCRSNQTDFKFLQPLTILIYNFLCDYWATK